MVRPLSAQTLQDLLSLRLTTGTRRIDLTRPGIGDLSTANRILQRRGLAELGSQLGQLRLSLDGLLTGESVAREAAAGPRTREPARVVSAELELAATPSATRLVSREEVNSVDTSFTPFGPVVSGASTTLPTLGGVYDGDQGDDTLTFEFRQNSVVGSGDRLRVRVYDGGGSRIQTLRFDDVDVDTPVTLNNGLTLSLSAGSASRFDTFSVDVSTSVGSSVDPGKPFDGTRNDDPNFEAGLQVVAGSFEVNGASIDVAVDDSIDSVIAKINAADAGVIASFDVASEGVVLVRESTGPESITLANDSSGFLAATKLDGAQPELGQDDTLANDPIQAVAALAGVGAGDFFVNGVEIDVDPASDSLEDLIARIDLAGTGVTASLASESSTLTFTADEQGQSFTLAAGSSGLLAALGITPGSFTPIEPEPSRPSSGFANLDRVEKNLSDLGSVLNGLFSAFPRLPETDSIRSGLRESILTSFEASFGTRPIPIYRSGYGLDFDFTRDRDVVEFDRERFERASIRSFDDLADFLFREGQDDSPQGLLPALVAEVESLQELLQARSGQLEERGRVVDLLA